MITILIVIILISHVGFPLIATMAYLQVYAFDELPIGPELKTKINDEVEYDEEKR